MISVLLIALLSLLAQLVLPWWSLAIVTFAFCYGRSRSAGEAFWTSFVGVALVWFGYALLIHTRTDNILTYRIAELLYKSQNVAGLLLVTPVLGGLVGGVAGLAGYFVRRAVQPQSITRHS